MTTSVSFRLSAAAFVVLTLPVLTSVVGRCAGQEAGRGVGGPGVLQGTDDAQRAADRRATARVHAAEVRTLVLVLRDPDDAYALLKGILDEVRDDPALSEPCRQRLQSRLERDLRGVVECGPFIKELETYWRVLKAEARMRLGLWRFEND